MRDIQFGSVPFGSIQQEAAQPEFPAFVPRPIERMPLSARSERRVPSSTSSHHLSPKHPIKIYPANQVIRSGISSAPARPHLCMYKKRDERQTTRDRCSTEIDRGRVDSLRLVLSGKSPAYIHRRRNQPAAGKLAGFFNQGRLLAGFSIEPDENL
jgi:hypothetical protein